MQNSRCLLIIPAPLLMLLLLLLFFTGNHNAALVYVFGFIMYMSVVVSYPRNVKLH